MLTPLYKNHTGIENNTVESQKAENKQQAAKAISPPYELEGLMILLAEVVNPHTTANVHYAEMPLRNIT